MVAEVAAGDNSEGPDGGQRARLGAPQGVDAITVTGALTFRTAWQIDVAREHVVRVTRTFRGLTVPLRPSRIVSGIARVLVGTLTVAPATAAAELPRIVIVTATRAALAVRLVLLPVAVVRACAAWSVRGLAVVIA